MPDLMPATSAQFEWAGMNSKVCYTPYDKVHGSGGGGAGGGGRICVNGHDCVGALSRGGGGLFGKRQARVWLAWGQRDARCFREEGGYTESFAGVAGMLGIANMCAP